MTSEDQAARTAQQIEKTLSALRVPAKVQKVIRGPTVTQYYLRPASHIRISGIERVLDDLTVALSAQSLRLLTPVPGQPFISLEVPNPHPDPVTLGQILNSQKWSTSSAVLKIALGKNTVGEVRVADLASMPHLLIAGTTGSGKSVCLTTIIAGLLWANDPHELRLVLIDPKTVELVAFEDVPHLDIPPVTDASEATEVLETLEKIMDKRYQQFHMNGVRNISDYNASAGHMPYIVIAIDELADLIASSDKEVEGPLIALAQKARAAGIHLIVATQRPSSDVITGRIKTNFPTRISFMVSTRVDSRVILDQAGAEQLTGRGDMLFMSPEAPRPERIQGALTTDSRLARVLAEVLDRDSGIYVESEIEEYRDSIDFDTFVSSEDEFDDGFDRELERDLEREFGQGHKMKGIKRAKRVEIVPAAKATLPVQRGRPQYQEISLDPNRTWRLIATIIGLAIVVLLAVWVFASLGSCIAAITSGFSAESGSPAQASPTSQSSPARQASPASRVATSPATPIPRVRTPTTTVAVTPTPTSDPGTTVTSTPETDVSNDPQSEALTDLEAAAPTEFAAWSNADGAAKRRALVDLYEAASPEALDMLRAAGDALSLAQATLLEMAPAEYAAWVRAEGDALRLALAALVETVPTELAALLRVDGENAGDLALADIVDAAPREYVAWLRAEGDARIVAQAALEAAAPTEFEAWQRVTDSARRDAPNEEESVRPVQWPTTCTRLNDMLETHLGNRSNAGIYQRVYGDQAEQACREDHRDDARAAFGWALAAGAAESSASAVTQWPMTCVDLNDIVESYLGNRGGVGIYERVFGDQAEQACRKDHRHEVEAAFAWALASP